MDTSNTLQRTLGAPLLRLSQVKVTYPNGTRALHPCSLEISEGSFVVLLGASGAGKSTLLRCLNGLVVPSAGQIAVGDLGGELLSDAQWRTHRQRTGMVFQQHHLIGRQSVLANVLMGRIAERSTFASMLPWRRSDKEAALHVIERVGLLDKALERADSLSGGQQQRVGIARALLQRPRLMLADEPVASLDPSTAERVLTLLHDICKTDGLTAVVSLHQVELARKFADRIIGMRDGVITFDGAPDALDSANETALYAGRSASPNRDGSEPATEALHSAPISSPLSSTLELQA